ncbi:MAG TPA: efflux RND transporter periplasmic adaptor subunit [Pyrinomonadaceae bacterium]|jgi:RND family efflux transporter MFP subunit
MPVTPIRHAGARKFQRIVFALFLCLLPVFAGSCKSDYQGASRQDRPGGNKATRQVKTARVEETPFGETVTANGTLAAFDQSTAGVKVAGRLSSIAVDLGSVVRRGQIVAQVEPNDYKLRVQQAEASLSQARARLGLAPEGNDDKVSPEQTGTVRQAKAQLDEARLNRERAVRLVEQGIVAKSDFDAADATFKVAQSRYQDALEEIRNRQALLAQRRSEVALARQQLADTAVYAPIDGIVQQKRASVGEYLAAGAPVVDIVRMNPLRLQAQVPERDAGTVRFGQNVRVSVEGDGKIYLGQIKRLSPVITAQNRMLMVEADVQNDGNLRPGSFAKAEIVTNDAKMAVTVPNNAIVTFAGIEKVIVVQNGKALEKPITTGRRSGEWTEILAGINVGDQVIVDPGNLQSGMDVEVVQ